MLTVDQQQHYFSGDRIECLICSKQLKSISGHLKCHNITKDEYRIKYGIAWTKSLECEELYNRRSFAQKKRIENNLEYKKILTDRVKIISQVGAKAKHRIRAKSVSDHVKSFHELYTRVDADNILEEIKKGKFLKDILKEHFGPKKNWWYSFLKANPDYIKRYDDIVENYYDFKKQASILKLGAKFKKELRILFDKGYSDFKAAKNLGVTAMACNRFTKEWRKAKCG